MKRSLLSLFLVSILFFITGTVIFAADGTESEKSNIFGILLSGAGGIGGAITWGISKISKLRKKIKELSDLPLVAAKGISNVSTQATEAITASVSIFKIIEDNAKENVSGLAIWELIKKQVKDVKKEMNDIPGAISQLREDLTKEWADVITKK